MNVVTNFAGDKKVGASILDIPEKKFVAWLTPKIAPYSETWGLTAMTIVWSILVIVFGYLAQYNIHWLWGSSVAIFGQYITDLFDGAVGRYKNTGLVRWGYYADHFLDYIFMCSMLVGYTFFIPDQYNILFYILIIYGGFFVNALLSFNCTNEFRVSFFGFGPTEGRIGFMVVSGMLILFGKVFLSPFLPYFLAMAFLILCFTVWKTQKIMWKIDMDKKVELKN